MGSLLRLHRQYFLLKNPTLLLKNLSEERDKPLRGFVQVSFTHKPIFTVTSLGVDIHCHPPRAEPQVGSQGAACVGLSGGLTLGLLEQCTGCGIARQQDVSHTKEMSCAATRRQKR